ncbi:MAG: hypothetical protein M1832_003519 [Thelocarpon impressellum]|nr:MAG: hypothetical protein M1832_003519 [Thelocarpon impressellum]
MADAVPSIESTQSHDFEEQPSCVEFSPLLRSLLIVGTYRLEDGAAGEDARPAGQGQRRSGGLFAVMFNPFFSLSIEHLPTPFAVFDVKFSPVHKKYLAVAGSDGQFQVIVHDIDGPSGHFPTAETQYYWSRSTLVLSVAWHPFLPLLAVTLSTGHVDIWHVQGEPDSLAQPTLRLQASAEGHELEVWTSAVVPVRQSDSQRVEGSSAYTVYSGGDDAALRSTSFDWTNEPLTVAQGRAHQPLRKQHEAGVTAILPLCEHEEAEGTAVLLTGSYDDRVRVIDAGRRSVLAEQDLGGGVWRLRFLRSPWAVRAAGARTDRDEEGGHFWILASCMHAGARVLHVTHRRDGAAAAWTIAVAARFTEHASMTYAGAVQPPPEPATDEPGRIWLAADEDRRAEEAARPAEQRVSCVSASFYDRLLCAWDFWLPREGGEVDAEAGDGAGAGAGAAAGAGAGGGAGAGSV